MGTTTHPSNSGLSWAASLVARQLSPPTTARAGQEELREDHRGGRGEACGHRPRGEPTTRGPLRAHPACSCPNPMAAASHQPAPMPRTQASLVSSHCPSQKTVLTRCPACLSAFCLHKRHVPRELACGHRGARPLPLTAPRHQLACLPAGRGPWLSPPTRATQFLHCLSSPISSCPASLPLWGPPADPAAAPGGASRVPTPTSHPGRLQPSEPPAGALCHTQPTPYVTAARLQHHPGGLTLLAPTVPGKARLKLRLHGGYKMLCSGSEKG